MTQTLAEKLLVLYRTSRPLEYTETQGMSALEWSQGILRQLKDYDSATPEDESPFEFAEPITEDKEIADLYTEKAIALAAPIFNEWLQTLEDHIFDGATDLGEVRDRIDSAFPEMDSADFADLMSKVLLSCYGAGRYTVIEESVDEADLSEEWIAFSEIPETATPVTDKGALSLLKRLIDSVYLAGITAIKYAYVADDNSIRCGFEDRISPKQTLSFDGRFSQSSISYGISDISASESIWEDNSLVEFAAPATIKPRNCNPAKSFQCGNSCQSLGRKCDKTPNAGQKNAIAAIVATTIPKKTSSAKTKKTSQKLSDAPTAEGGRPQAPELNSGEPATLKSALYNPDLDKSAINPDLHRLYDLASGIASPETIKFTSDQIEQTKAYLKMNASSTKQSQPKIKKIIKASPTIEEHEAAALANWVSNNYKPMNQRIYDPNGVGADKDALLVLNEMAATAIHKLPPITTAQIEKEAAKKGEIFDATKPLNRYLEITEPESFVKRYADALDSDQPFMETTFFATTHLDKDDMEVFANTANIKYSVKPKLDGTGSGRYVDHYKNQASEGEILYPPMSKFRVNAVRRTELVQLSPDEESAYSDWMQVETANFLKSMGNKDWKTKYKKQTGKAYPKKEELNKMEQLYYQAADKKRKLKSEFNGYEIELEEI